MAVLTLGEATARALGAFPIGSGGRPHAARSGAPHRTGAPVRRDSIEAGTFEDTFFAVPAKGEPDRLLRMARGALDAGRRLKRIARVEGRALTASERALAALTAGAVRVYEEILTLARLNRGRVFPSYDRLAEATALGRATVARALIALETAGFLLRQRRFKRVAGDGPGPRYEQTSNAYRPLLPARLLGHLPRWLRPAPLPDDVVQRSADRAEDQAAMLARLSCRELAQATTGGALGRVLARLGAALDAAEGTHERESQNHPQPLLDSNIKEHKALASTANRVRPDGPPRHQRPDPYAASRS